MSMWLSVYFMCLPTTNMNNSSSSFCGRFSFVVQIGLADHLAPLGLDWRWLQRQELVAVIVHVVLLRVLLLEAEGCLDGPVVRFLLQHRHVWLLHVREHWLIAHFDFVLNLELLQKVVFARLVVARASFSVFESWRALSHAEVLVR